MIKKIIGTFFVVFLSLAVLSSVLELRKNRIGAILKNTAEKAGSLENGKEFHLAFQVNYLGAIPLGKASFRLTGLSQYQGKPVYLLSLDAEDAPPFSWIKEAKAKLSSYADTSKITPYFFSTYLDIEGKDREENEIIYNQKDGFMLSEGKKYKILPQTREPLSLIFYLMKEDFSAKKSFSLNLNSNQSNYRVKAEVHKKKIYLLKNKDYSVWEIDISLRRRNGSMRHSLEATAYFLEGLGINIPLLIKASTNMGSVLLRLEGIG